MTTIEAIYEAVITQLGTTYPVLRAYDGSVDVSPDGIIAVNISEFEHLDHNGVDDYRFAVEVKGQTIADDDKTRAKIYAMQAYVMRTLSLDGLKDAIDNCAGAVMGSMFTTSDGDSNGFDLSFDLYICDAVFEDSSSSSSTVDDSSNSSNSSD